METPWERVALTRWRFSPSFGLHCAANRALRVLCLPRAWSPQGESHWGCGFRGGWAGQHAEAGQATGPLLCGWSGPQVCARGDSCLPVRREAARSNGGCCWLRVRWEENRGPSANRSCKERRQPAENSPAWKKGSSQGALAQPLSFLIMPSVFQLLGVGPPEAGLGKEVLASLCGDGRSVCRGGMMAGLMNLNEEHATFRRPQWLALMTERWENVTRKVFTKRHPRRVSGPGTPML